MRAVLPSFVEKILFSFLSGNNRSQMVRLPREIVIFTGNDSDLNECTGLGLNKFGAGPGFPIFVEDRIRFGNFREQVLSVTLAFPYLCKRSEAVGNLCVQARTIALTFHDL